jgi:hypothetical protein
MMRITNNVKTLASRMNIDTSKLGESMKASAGATAAAGGEDTVTISAQARELAGKAAMTSDSGGLRKIGQLGSKIQNQTIAKDFSARYKRFLEESDFQETQRRKAIVDRIPPDLGPRLDLNKMQTAGDAMTGKINNLNSITASLRSVNDFGTNTLEDDSSGAIGSSGRTYSNSLFM